MTDNIAVHLPAPTPSGRSRRSLVVALTLTAVVAVSGVIGSANDSDAARYDASVDSTIADIQSY